MTAQLATEQSDKIMLHIYESKPRKFPVENQYNKVRYLKLSLKQIDESN